MPVGTRAQPQLDGVCHWLINDYSDVDEIPASETALRGGLITGLPDERGCLDKARHVRALSCVPPAPGAHRRGGAGRSGAAARGTTRGR